MEESMETQRPDRTVALITGGNRGIGFEIARQLGQRGMTVLIGARDADRGRQAAGALHAEGIDAQAVLLDVTRQSTIEVAAQEIGAEFGILDILVNNAGVQLDHEPPSAVSPETLRRTYETNVFGPFAVTVALLPLLRRSDAGRIVNLTSSLGSLALNSDPAFKFAHLKHLAYNSSKAALNALTIQLAYDLRDTLIKINAADPGYTATAFNDYQGTRTVQQGAAVAVRYATLPADGPSGGFFNEAGPVPW